MRERKRRILAAATQLISDGGVEACTMRALARAADLDVTTLYNYYGSKDEILDALRRSTGRRIENEVEALPEMPPFEKLRAIVEVWIGATESPPQVARPINLNLPRRIPGTGPVERRVKKMLVHELERARDSGLLSKALESEYLALTILGHSRVWMPLWARGRVRADEALARMDYGLGLCLLAAATESSHEDLAAQVMASQSRLQSVIAARKSQTAS